ncbi:hypothetical protein M758_1G198300 [Ceratodon purpureus]|nr:hypothetical protein M758_1G198300 [Ceratodon purpureus]
MHILSLGFCRCSCRGFLPIGLPLLHQSRFHGDGLPGFFNGIQYDFALKRLVLNAMPLVDYFLQHMSLSCISELPPSNVVGLEYCICLCISTSDAQLVQHWIWW